ncbi:MAG TPA: GH25 family lysozyme [Streptosporangiaceae bacterium]|nr:GH25 family lysozyme [Streptosporangiaceae bacterium]
MAGSRLRSLLRACGPGRPELTPGLGAVGRGAVALAAPATVAVVVAAVVVAAPASATAAHPTAAHPVAARAGHRGDRYNVGATHSPQLLAQLRNGPAAPAAPAPAGRAQPSYRQGVDVAAFQHPNGAAINWAKVVRSGISFAAVKATEGTYYQNPYALSDIEAAQAAGLSVGAYAFAIPNGNGGRSNAVTQADYLVNYLGPLASSVPVMLDIEFNPYSGGVCYGRRGPRMVSWVARFSAEVQARTGRAPYIYTPPGWWDRCTGGSTALHKDPLWVPSYTTVGSPALPAGWATWTIWQYSSAGTVSGIPDPGFTDLDRLQRGVIWLGP